MDDALAHFLARRARALHLDPATLTTTDPETLRAFAQTVLTELAARGLLPAEAEVGCWSAPRVGGN